MHHTEYTQLTFDIKLREEASFSNFYINTENAPLINMLRSITDSNREPFVYFWGLPGGGRTHLLHAICHQANEVNVSAIYFPLGDFKTLDPTMLNHAECLSIICIDDIQAIAGQAAWEEALFNLYNHAREAGTKIIVSADNIPTELSLGLPDLVSRLQWGPIFKLARLTDEQKLLALQQRAHEAGMKLTEEVGKYLLHHLSRDFNTLYSALKRLEEATLVEKRTLTIPFVKRVFGL